MRTGCQSAYAPHFPHMLPCYASGVEQVLIFRSAVEFLALIQVIRCRAARLVPLWCLWVAFDLFRICWLAMHGAPDQTAYAVLWRVTETWWLGLLIAASAEAFFRPSSYYPGSKQLALIAAMILVTLAIVITLIVCLPAQSKIIWSYVELGQVMQLHQLVLGAVSLLMFQAVVLFQALYYPFPPFFQCHALLMGLYGLLGSTVVLLNNTRTINGLWSAALDDLGIAVCFGGWAYWSQSRLVKFTHHSRIATAEEVEQAHQKARQAINSIREKD